ncbi:MAG TPA: hypothetical protein PK280_05430 [Planctomycetota bacterium]|nr:hypothetical protein [Planctomycetota bacterium]
MAEQPDRTDAPAQPAHRAFRLTGGWRLEGLAPSLSPSGLLMLQAGIGIPWFLFWGLVLCAGAGRMALWLPLNFLLFDLYLLARAGLRLGSADKTSRSAVRMLRLSPLLMVISAFILGLVGSGLRQALD